MANLAQTPVRSLFKSLLLYLLFSAIVILSAWFWLTWQLKALLEHRVSEIGHQLAEVTAIASAEAVLSEDKEYLTHLLQQLVEKDKVLQAAIFRLDGTLIVEQTSAISQTSKDTNMDATASLSQEPTDPSYSLENLLTAHIPKYRSPSVPFMVEIDWQNTSVGWLQITLDRWQLEQSFRHSSYQVTLYSLIAFCVSSLLSFILLWHRRRTKSQAITETTDSQDKTLSTSDIHSLREAAAQLKNNPNHPQLHFKSVNLHRFTPLNPPTQQHHGLVQIFSLKLKYSETSSPEQLLTQQLTWHNIMFEAASLMNLNARLIGRHQYLIIGEHVQLENMVKLGFLIHSIQQQLSCLPHLACQCSMLLGKSDLFIKNIDSQLSFVVGEEFNRWLVKLRQLKSYGLIDQSLASELTLKSDDPDMHQISIEIENHPDHELVLEPKELALIERQTQSLIKKYWQEPSLAEDDSSH
jgi:uncharacterized membrane protein affecting hemolysin expression